jgi:hypothetical protein
VGEEDIRDRFGREKGRDGNNGQGRAGTSRDEQWMNRDECPEAPKARK